MGVSTVIPREAFLCAVGLFLAGFQPAVAQTTGCRPGDILEPNQGCPIYSITYLSLEVDSQGVLCLEVDGFFPISCASSTLTERFTADGVSVALSAVRDQKLAWTLVVALPVPTFANREPEPSDLIDSQSLTVHQDSTISVSAFFRDPDGDDLSFRVISSDPSIAEASVFADTMTITPKAEGVVVITVTARDPGSLTATQTFDVDVVLAPESDCMASNCSFWRGWRHALLDETRSTHE